MADFASMLKRVNTARKPPRVITLGPAMWADTREDKPLDSVQIGIRLISEHDTGAARSSAARVAVELMPVGTEDDRIEAYNCALMRFASEYGTCSPTNVDEPYFVMGELEIRQRLTAEAARRLWHEIEALHIASNPSLPEIDDEGTAHLFALLHREALTRLDRADAALVRRLLEQCRTYLAEAPDSAD